MNSCLEHESVTVSRRKIKIIYSLLRFQFKKTTFVQIDAVTCGFSIQIG